MKIFDSYRLLMTPLSPIHIGTGDSYEPTNYVIEEELLHEFDTGEAVAAMTTADRKVLLDIASRKPNPEMIQAMQRFFFERREVLMAYGVNRIPVLPGVADLYRSRVGQAANLEANGNKVFNQLEIDRTAYNPITRLPVLFGSSLKGAIRTALLDGLNGGAPRQKVEDQRTGKRRDENNKELQQRLLQYQSGKFELDPLRLIQLADAVWNGEPDLPATQVYLAVNRKKAPVKDEQGHLRQSMAENLYQTLVECVPGWRYQAFSSQINLQSVDGIKNNRQGQRYLPASALRFDMEQIAQACNAFYRPLLEVESRKMREGSYLDPEWDRTIGVLLEQARARMDHSEVFLLRVGRHSGAEAVTLNGVRNIKIMQGKGRKPTHEATTKTFWLAANDTDQKQKLLPFGWLLVEVQPLDSSPEDWLELKTTCEPYLTHSRALAAKLAAKQAMLEQIRLQAEAKRREEAEQAQRRAEEEARLAQAEAERQAQLAAMSPEEKLIDDLRCLFADENQRNTLSPGSATIDKLNQLLAQAEGWSSKVVHGLIDLAEEVYRHKAVGWGSGEKKRARRARIEALRTRS
jgi:CRISPR-associated protein Csm5